MNEKLVLVFAEGFKFLGKEHKVSIACDGIKDAVSISTVNVMTPQGPGSFQVMQVVGNISLNGKYPTSDFDATKNRDMYAEYVKLTTGIDIPSI